MKGTITNIFIFTFSMIAVVFSIFMLIEMGEIIFAVTFGIVTAITFPFSFLWWRKQIRIAKGKDVAKPGERFSVTVDFSGDFAHKSDEIKKLIVADGYKEILYGQEVMFSKHGFMAPRFIKFNHNAQGFIIEAFVVGFNRESNLEGFIGNAPKKQLKKLTNKIIELIRA